MDKHLLRVAAKISRELERDYQDYLESAEQDRREGHRPHYCEHGTNQWTDWDNICGPCEDGLSLSDGVFRRRVALDRAQSWFAGLLEIVEAYSVLAKHGITVDAESYKRAVSITP